MSTSEQPITPAVMAAFSEKAQAVRAVHDLEKAGFTADQVGFVMREGGTGAKESNQGEPTTGGMGGDAAATMTGATIGGILAALGALTIPAVGPILAAGIASAALGGATVGGTVGLVFGPLFDSVPQEEAQYFETQLQQGNALVIVRPGAARLQDARDLLSKNGGFGIYNRAQPAS